MTRKLNGLPATRVLWSYLKQLNPASAADRRRAIRLGLGMRDASRSLLGLSRYYGHTHSPEITKVIADDVLRVSEIGRAPVCTPVTNSHLVCHLMHAKKKTYTINDQYTKY